MSRRDIHSYKAAPDEWCEGCELDDHPDGTPAIVTLAIGWLHTRRATLCERCLISLQDCIGLALYKYGSDQNGGGL